MRCGLRCVQREVFIPKNRHRFLMNQLYVCVETVSVETNDALAILHFTVKNFHEWVPVINRSIFLSSNSNPHSNLPFRCRLRHRLGGMQICWNRQSSEFSLLASWAVWDWISPAWPCPHAVPHSHHRLADRPRVFHHLGLFHGCLNEFGLV